MKAFEDVVVVRTGYIRATNDKRQHWHRDRPLTRKTQGKALPVFVLCNVDIPADASCGRYVPLFHEGVPQPRYEYPMDMDVGDMVVFAPESIHSGGAGPVGRLAGTPRVITFIALANYNLHYNNTVPISPHCGPMPRRGYQHRRNVGVMDAARMSHNPRPYASCGRRSHCAKSMELEVAPLAMQHLPPQHLNSLKCVLRINGCCPSHLNASMSVAFLLLTVKHYEIWPPPCSFGKLNFYVSFTVGCTRQR